MTTFMKIEAITYYILKVFGYFCGFVGVFGVIGFAGSCELGTITIAQFWMYEIHAFFLIALSYVVYYIREAIKEDGRKRYRRMMRATKKVAYVK